MAKKLFINQLNFDEIPLINISCVEVASEMSTVGVYRVRMNRRSKYIYI